MAYPDGWFKVSRRLFESSRWHRDSAEALKVLVFLIGKAQDPMNLEPGVIHMGETAIAAQTSLPLPSVRAALAALAAADPESRTRRDDGCTIERLEDGSGYRLVNFDEYHPGEQERAEARREKARKAANARWSKAGVRVVVEPMAGPESVARTTATSNYPGPGAEEPQGPTTTRASDGAAVSGTAALDRSPENELLGDRREAERRGNALIREIAQLVERDATEVIAEVGRRASNGYRRVPLVRLDTLQPDQLARVCVELAGWRRGIEQRPGASVVELWSAREIVRDAPPPSGKPGTYELLARSLRIDASVEGVHGAERRGDGRPAGSPGGAALAVVAAEGHGPGDHARRVGPGAERVHDLRADAGGAEDRGGAEPGDAAVAGAGDAAAGSPA